MSSVNLSWDADGTIDFYTIYRSESPMSVESLPAPLAENVLDKTYSDITVVDGITYYYRVASVRGGVAKVSDEVMVKAQAGDEYWDNVVGLYRYDGSNIVDLSKFGGSLILNTGLSVDNTITSPTDSPALKLGSYKVAAFNTPQLGLDDFTVEMWFRCDSSHQNWPRVWATKNQELNGAGYYNMQLQGSGINYGGLSFFAGTDFIANRGESLIGAFNHLAFIRSGINIYTAVNGVIVATTHTPVNDVNGLFVLGHGYASYVPMWFNEIRITKGIARYTANFIPPDAPFPSN